VTTVFRKQIGAIAISLLICTCSGAGAQENWPSRRVSLVVAFSAGGYADTIARIIARELGERLNQPVIVQNVGGAGGNTAARQISVSAPDGYTFLITTTGVAINDSLYRNKPFDTSQLVPVAIPVSAPEALTSNPKSGIKNFADMLAAAKEGRAYMGSPGIGTASHISAEYFFKHLAKVNVKHIPFSGGSESMQALRVGDINVRAATVTTLTIPSIANGEIVGLAVATEQRDPVLPNVPTFAEMGYPGFIATNWVGVFARAGTPDAILNRMNVAINSAMDQPDVRKRMDALSLSIASRSLVDTRSFFKAEIGRWATMVEASGLSK
jgi:tripartite-type tricarboxylate transporter receptor subunit TctC